jgi:hypothetical protein
MVDGTENGGENESGVSADALEEDLIEESDIDELSYIVICNQKERSIAPPPRCDVPSRRECESIPPSYGAFCAYESAFINDRAGNIIDVFGVFRERFPPEEYFYKINERLVLEISGFYANDIKRDRSFHDLDGGGDRSRRAAYLARLISNFRPIIIGTDFWNCQPKKGKIIPKWTYRLNEFFALTVFLHFLEVRGDILDVIPNGDRLAINLIFTFAHRDPQPELLMAVGKTILMINDLLGKQNNGAN